MKKPLESLHGITSLIKCIEFYTTYAWMFQSHMILHMVIFVFHSLHACYMWDYMHDYMPNYMTLNNIVYASLHGFTAYYMQHMLDYIFNNIV
jgi:hypothetical protein